ncbi:MAG: M81 family metallopeptidase [Caldilineaceae bacterium]|nr:M81 family metallopeptidase [Caldilineaceae bacterium]
MKVFAGGVATETNTFSPMPTGMRDYLVVRPGDEVEQGTMTAFDQFESCTIARGWDYVFGLYAWAQPAGVTTRVTYESLRDELLERLQEALPVDIVLLGLHGAMVADGYDDCETDIIERVRQIVGPEVKIGVELDLHCDVTQSMIDTAEAIVLYKEYPHTDVANRAADLFNIVADAAEGKTKPTMALFDCRMIGLYLTPNQPLRGLVDDLLAMEGNDGLLSVSLVHCFPWGDVPTCGAQSLAITDGDPVQAARVAEEVGRRFFAMRHELDQVPWSIDEALDQALAADSGPVVIADRADNAGGGAPSDSTFMLRAMLERGIENAGVAMIWDPIAVQTAISGGVGANLDIRLGGKMGKMSGDPLDLRVKVAGVVEDMFQEWPQQGDPMRIPCGDSVCLHCNGIDIVVSSRRVQPFSPDVYTNFGIDVASKRILVVKSSQHFFAGYAPIASEIIYMAAPGAVAPRYTEIPFQRVDLHKYPWVDDPFA